jgi:flagellar biosynthetic protein FlhB
MADDQGEKTEEPTEHKLQEARKKGQVFKSMEIISAFQFAAMAMVIAWTGSWASRNITSFTRGIYDLIPHLSFRQGDIWHLMLKTLMLFAKVILPLLVVAFITALLLNILQTGFVFSTTPLTPTWQKISPIEGFKRMFSRKSLLELFKQLFKLTIIGWVTYKIVRNSIITLSTMVVWSLHDSLFFVKSLIFKIIWYVTAAYIVLAVVDFLIQKKLFMMEMRMSIQELKDEFKDTEGDPHVKMKLRQLQRQMVQQAMMQKVPNATAVITNPTHLAVALEYEQGKMEAPVVVAKGERLVAQRIKEIAEENDIPVIENVGLARALFEACKVGQMIPGDLYKAVAEVLAFVYRLKKKKEMAKRRAILRIRDNANLPRKSFQKGGK